MALETLEGVEEIDGFKVGGPASGYSIRIDRREDENDITFTLQNGPIKEVGVNGCQVDTIVDAAMTIIMGLNEKFPCDENATAITHLGMALAAMKARKANREKRGVEGESKL